MANHEPFDDLVREFEPKPEDVPWLEELSCPRTTNLPTYFSKSAKDADNAALLFANVRKDVPGLAISDFPRAFLVRRKIPEHHVKAGLIRADARQFQVFTMPALWANRKAVWSYIKASLTEKPPYVLADPYVRPNGWVDPDYFDTAPFKKWDYPRLAEKCAPGKQPSEHDLPNPRLYWLDGTLAYVQEPWWPHWIRGEFKRMVVDLFMDPKPLRFMTREPRLFAFLDHHKNNGGNPPAFVEYVRELTVQPPPSFSAYMVDRMAYWVTQQSKRTKKQAPRLQLSDLFASAEIYSKWMELLRDEGHIDGQGHWAKDKGAKGKRIVWVAFKIATETPSGSGTMCADLKGTAKKTLTMMFNDAIRGLNYAGRTDRLSKSEEDLKKDFLPKWSKKVNGK